MWNQTPRDPGRGKPNPVGTGGRIVLVAALAFAAATGLVVLRNAGSARLGLVNDAHVSVRIEAPHFSLNIQWKD